MMQHQHSSPTFHFERRDLNEQINGSPAPVLSGASTRARIPFMYPAGFGAGRVTIVNRSAASRYLVSFHRVENSGMGTPIEPHIDGVVEPGPDGKVFDAPPGQPFGWVVVWIDPQTPVTSGSAVVEISA